MTTKTGIEEYPTPYDADIAHLATLPWGQTPEIMRRLQELRLLAEGYRGGYGDVTLLRDSHDALLEALRMWVQGYRRIDCPGCRLMHNDGHEDTCACDHCALVIKTLALTAAAEKGA